MADNLILTPGMETPEPIPTPPENSTVYLEKDNYLSEYATEGEKSVVRENLNVPSKDLIYSKLDVDIKVSSEIRDALLEYLNMDDPHGILPTVLEMIEGMVKDDGSTPFTAPQAGVDPIADNHLTTKKFVTRLLREHANAEDPHGILPEVRLILEKYVKTSDIYDKSQLYTKNEIDLKESQFMKTDGTTPLTKALIGADPIIDSHLATKRYVDKSLYSHLVDVDPHGFISILNSRLSQYIKRKEVWDKTLTYSRTQIDSLINRAVNTAIDQSMADYMDSINDKFEYIRLQKYVKQDGSIPFSNPQAGQDAIEDNDLTTLKQVKQFTEAINSDLSSKIKEKESLWKPSGPVESTVGHVEDNSILQSTMTLQEVCDAIFYGNLISLEVPEFVVITKTCPVTMCIHGSTGTVQLAELFLNGELIYTFTREAFEEGCVTVDSLPLLEDAEFTFKVTYTNGSVHLETKKVKCYLPVFVGLLPKWKFGHTITMDYLIQLAEEDVEGTQNRFFNQGEDMTSMTFKYSFTDPDLRHPFIVVPLNYPDLESMVTKSQSFDVAAFDIIDMIPLSVPGVPKDMIFKVYIYRLALSSLNQEVTFNFMHK